MTADPDLTAVLAEVEQALGLLGESEEDWRRHMAANGVMGVPCRPCDCALAVYLAGVVKLPPGVWLEVNAGVVSVGYRPADATFLGEMVVGHCDLPRQGVRFIARFDQEYYPELIDPKGGEE